jgi:hypothetical protein
MHKRLPNPAHIYLAGCGEKYRLRKQPYPYDRTICTFPRRRTEPLL